MLFHLTYLNKNISGLIIHHGLAFLFYFILLNDVFTPEIENDCHFGQHHSFNIV